MLPCFCLWPSRGYPQSETQSGPRGTCMRWWLIFMQALLGLPLGPLLWTPCPNSLPTSPLTMSSQSFFLLLTVAIPSIGLLLSQVALWGSPSSPKPHFLIAPTLCIWLKFAASPLAPLCSRLPQPFPDMLKHLLITRLVLVVWDFQEKTNSLRAEIFPTLFTQISQRSE